MPVTSISVKANVLPSPALRRFAWGVLAYFIAVILWGTLVRATGSGASTLGGGGHEIPLAAARRYCAERSAFQATTGRCATGRWCNTRRACRR